MPENIIIPRVNAFYSLFFAQVRAKPKKMRAFLLQRIVIWFAISIQNEFWLFWTSNVSFFR